MADSYLKSALAGRMSGAGYAVGGMALMKAEQLDWLVPYVHDFNYFTGLALDPSMIQRWTGLAIMITGFILPMVSKIREGKK